VQRGPIGFRVIYKIGRAPASALGGAIKCPLFGRHSVAPLAFSRELSRSCHMAAINQYPARKTFVSHLRGKAL
jgi:hypothetical protein